MLVTGSLHSLDGREKGPHMSKLTINELCCGRVYKTQLQEMMLNIIYKNERGVWAYEFAKQAGASSRTFDKFYQGSRFVLLDKQGTILHLFSPKTLKFYEYWPSLDPHEDIKPLLIECS